MSAQRKLLRKVYGPAAALALASIAGLLSALLGDGVWDAVSWLFLGIPVAVMLWCSVRRSPKSS